MKNDDLTERMYARSEDEPDAVTAPIMSESAAPAPRAQVPKAEFDKMCRIVNRLQKALASTSQQVEALRRTVESLKVELDSKVDRSW